ncbi:uncharacterized protein LOC121000006 [Bufo bufo]|uniref:uncharacterized protein LOC120981696 n=1 Tax=Bufo bufo TaxID=8384 RepID=UPI001ABE5BC7|nr:uncharacterized protein LOC120981696 [Bufo bufo]XP_040269326.1 uncharacterized protein LOC120984586 [Bufo bufo]XP_040269370.1 uncharacterized protein LOC120984842 [Bufo bufo]XP_040273701.1 uncharacterized protein LOC120989574 [Bufo bufo]XP_040284592.1 uncharacterized protein LOC120998127 [Bufo bufo]XP_040286967.1 uncharacterized protein LOC121000006 [Bufo bufo]
MESVSKTKNRTPQTCPVCYRPHKILSTHLKRKCMRLSTDEARKAALESAKKTLVNIASKGTTISYDEIMSLGSLEKVVPFLEDRGFIISDKPASNRNVRQEITPTSVSAATSTLQAVASQVQPLHTEDDEDTFQPQEDLEVAHGNVEPEEEIEDVPAETEDQDIEERDSIPEEDHEEGQERRQDEEIEEIDNLDSETQRILQTKWTVNTRKKMMAEGLYQRHSLDNPMLKGFASYLKDTLKVNNYKQEVEDVARFLFYMNPKTVNLQFVKDVEKANAFFTKLRDLNLANQTIFNYLKHVRRFMTYQLRSTNLFTKHPNLYKSCEFFHKVTDDIQKRLSKGISREVVSKRYQALTTTSKTPQECRRLLDVAKPSFSQCFKDVQGRNTDRETYLEILYYLEALLILKHLQRPGVVQNMTVSEWKERISHTYNGEDLAIVGVKLHKTASQQVATFVLNKEEEMWFKVYFEKARPKLLQKDSPKDTFFISTSGKEIYNVSNDIMRYHKKFKLPNISSQLVRRVCETWTIPHYSDSEKNMFSKYLAHTNLTAERSYREKTLTDICHGYQLVIQAGQVTSDEPQASTSRHLDPEEHRESQDDHSEQDEDITSQNTSRNRDSEDRQASQDEDSTSKDENSNEDEDITSQDTISDEDDTGWTSRAPTPSVPAMSTRSCGKSQTAPASSSREKTPSLPALSTRSHGQRQTAPTRSSRRTKYCRRSTRLRR